MMEGVKDYIKASKNPHPMIWGKVAIYSRDEVSKGVDLNALARMVENVLPSYMFENVSSVVFGEYATLSDREIDSAYDKQIIFISNEVYSEKDVVDNIVHETAHSLEEIYSSYLYSDLKLEKEFLNKRVLLFNELSKKYKLNKNDFLNPNFKQKLDSILYQKIGYDALSFFTERLFLTAYSTTSLREYFSEGFEVYYLGGKEQVRETCQILFLKIKGLEGVLKTNG